MRNVCSGRLYLNAIPLQLEVRGLLFHTALVAQLGFPIEIFYFSPKRSVIKILQSEYFVQPSTPRTTYVRKIPKCSKYWLFLLRFLSPH